MLNVCLWPGGAVGHHSPACGTVDNEEEGISQVAKTIPKSQAVNSAFRQLAKRLDALRKKVNSTGAKRMRANQYDTARKWMDIGQLVGSFRLGQMSWRSSGINSWSRRG